MMRYSNGTLALCMNPSEPKTTTLISTTKITNQQRLDSSATIGKHKLQQKTKQNKELQTDSALEKRRLITASVVLRQDPTLFLKYHHYQ